MAKKGNRVQVILECTEHKNSGKPGTLGILLQKIRKTLLTELSQEIESILKKMTVHKEIK